MNAKRTNALLERVRDLIAPGDTESGNQGKAEQQNKVSTSAARQKLRALRDMQKSGRKAENEIQATGSRK